MDMHTCQGTSTDKHIVGIDEGNDGVARARWQWGIWEDNASRIRMSENPTNRDRSRHVDVKVHSLHDLVRDERS